MFYVTFSTYKFLLKYKIRFISNFHLRNIFPAYKIFSNFFISHFLFKMFFTSIKFSLNVLYHIFNLQIFPRYKIFSKCFISPALFHVHICTTSWAICIASQCSGMKHSIILSSIFENYSFVYSLKFHFIRVYLQFLD